MNKKQAGILTLMILIFGIIPISVYIFNLLISNGHESTTLRDEDKSTGISKVVTNKPRKLSYTIGNIDLKGNNSENIFVSDTYDIIEFSNGAIINAEKNQLSRAVWKAKKIVINDCIFKGSGRSGSQGNTGTSYNRSEASYDVRRTQGGTGRTGTQGVGGCVIIFEADEVIINGTISGSLSGGKGGKGGMGGTGQKGFKGRCTGYNGSSGGRGGTGGTGGTGGAGGDFIIRSKKSISSEELKLIKISVDGGAGGDAGEPGRGGPGGDGRSCDWPITDKRPGGQGGSGLRGTEGQVGAIGKININDITIN